MNTIQKINEYPIVKVIVSTIMLFVLWGVFGNIPAFQ